MTLATGTTLQNRYRIVRLAGQGGFGAVYRGWDLSLERPVAVKENNYAGPEAQRQFEREAKLLAGLRHPNLPVVIDHFILPGQGQYLVMDYVEGQSLGAMLVERGRPLDEAEVLQWLRQVMSALSYLHSRTPPVIHRDIKPDNVIITTDGQAMLVDFGISKLYADGKATTVSAQAVTPGFSPLEQYGSGRTDARSDVYALGATLYRLLTGQVPPAAPDLAGEPALLTPIRQLNPAVSETTATAVMAAMQPTISQRLPSVSAFEQLLPTGGLASSVPLQSTVILGTVGFEKTEKHPSPAVTTPGGSQRSIPVWLWAVGVITIVGLALLAGWAFGPGNTDQPRGTTPDGEAAGIDTPRPTVMPTGITTLSPTAAPTNRPTASATIRPTASATAIPSQTPMPSPTPLPEVGSMRAVTLPGGLPVEQVFVPAGSFMMGSEDGLERERPVHEVALDEFWIDLTEVTNAQFAAFVADTGHETTAEREGTGVTFTSGEWRDTAGADWQRPLGPGTAHRQEEHPVVHVSWDDATAFCEWAGGRLPTEAEWEYAARGNAGSPYPWGDRFDGNRLNYCDQDCPLPQPNQGFDDGHAFTAPVGTYPDGASWVGALDMSGNVWEWVNDRFDSQYYSQSPARNPAGPTSGNDRVLRGGAWNNADPSVARAAYRFNSQSDFRGLGIGFRCVQE